MPLLFHEAVPDCQTQQSEFVTSVSDEVRTPEERSPSSFLLFFLLLLLLFFLLVVVLPQQQPTRYFGMWLEPLMLL
ncbi:hypothetical protein ILYODFUR_000950 [Ilyodon furcidens]|uniref:Uncharacterized protein n=1 Tax=Ilyodon furcidens TaxID=33524 RepID=A0ABV0UMY4_9TELE